MWVKNAHLRALPGAVERLALCKADLLDYDALSSAVAGCHDVFHTASPGSDLIIIVEYGTKKNVKDDDVQTPQQVISLYIELMRHEEYGKHREGRNVYLENSWWSQILKANGEQDPEDLGIKRQAAVESRVKDYLKADMVFLPINIPLCHWYLAVVNTLKRKIQVLDSFGMEMMDSIGMQMIECVDVRNTVIPT
ncbi:uncharacterized protein LOC8063719 [Sorghum bicolor]|uniref:uncharacterized protein LOC8063719 n=1 Tax=Sorghum bicolor TaxID=4558 RepID=UPI000B425E25|nr:uncharacterized protein LOC8063719 [Sorghum bicolor]|eukprot:XP_021309228.1 uncharacterized protein LOC8063719 [Sorghum bicolor]